MTDMINKIDMQNRVNQLREVNKASAQSKVNPFGNNVASEALKRNSLPTGANFKTMLDEQLAKNSPLQFSKHAQERVEQRGIELTEELLGNLNDAISKARDKGAKDIVIIDARQAFIVNVPNNVVVTTVTEKEMKENVFTNIDSAVII